MAVWIAPIGAWLLQGAAALHDTVYVKQVAENPSAFERISGIASGLVSITLLVLTAALVPAAWNFRKSYKKTSELLDRIYGDINPIMRHASTIADNVDYITTTFRVDVQRINRTLLGVNDRLERAVEDTETRVKEFNALLRVVQQEAEETFISTASTLRGVRTGAASLRSAVHAELTTEDGAAPDALQDGLHDEDGRDVDDTTGTTEDRLPGPRIRPRERGRGLA
jgi:uncharacterized protein YoxC